MKTTAVSSRFKTGIAKNFQGMQPYVRTFSVGVDPFAGSKGYFIVS
jgi:hypothetical protein